MPTEATWCFGWKLFVKEQNGMSSLKNDFGD